MLATSAGTEVDGVAGAQLSVATDVLTGVGGATGSSGFPTSVGTEGVDGVAGAQLSVATDVLTGVGGATAASASSGFPTGTSKLLMRPFAQ